MQDFAPFTPELLGALSGHQTPGCTATVQSNCALHSWSTRFTVWRATRLRNLGSLLATY
jgi:hypothetical protein